jgi:hypothetical protein
VGHDQEVQPRADSHEDKTLLFIRVIWVSDETAELIGER